MLTNPMFAGMIDDVDWYFIPMINVDGYIETWTGVSFFSKSNSCSALEGQDSNILWEKLPIELYPWNAPRTHISRTLSRSFQLYI